MIERAYTIPVLFGICLGLIMAGVYVSASALNCAVGGRQDLSPLAVHPAPGGGVEIQILGRNTGVRLPVPEITGETRVNTLERAVDLGERACRIADAAARRLSAFTDSCMERFRQVLESRKTVFD